MGRGSAGSGWKKEINEKMSGVDEGHQAIGLIPHNTHNITVIPESLNFGRGQIIWRDENGVLVGATEPRTDGTVAVW